MIKLLVVEDHVLVREGLVQVLRQLEKDVTLFEAGNCDTGLAIIDREPDLDLVLLDLALPGLDGLAGLSLFRSRHPSVPVVIVSAYDDSHTVNRAMKHGASGFVPKAYPSDKLLAALRDVLAGNIHVPEQLIPANLGSDLPPIPLSKDASPAEFGLTDRQAEVLSLISKGKSNRDIAVELGLSEGTVKIHITAIFKALGVSSRTQALVAVARHSIRLP
jgi:DNA-binding NarL/FixJ family response regulator